MMHPDGQPPSNRNSALAQVARRYLGLAIVLAIVLVVVLLAPTTAPR